MIPWESHSVENGWRKISKLWKILARKYWNLVGKYFPPEDCTIFLGPSWGLLGTSLTVFMQYGLYFCNSWCSSFLSISRENEKIWSKTFFSRRLHSRPKTLLGLFGALLTVFTKGWSYIPNFGSHGFWAENYKIMMEFCAPSFTQLISNYRVDDELYDSFRRKPGWRFTAGV